jgi:hypothetical protein
MEILMKVFTTSLSAIGWACMFLATTAAAQSAYTPLKPYPWARPLGKCAQPGATVTVTNCKPPPDWPDLTRSVQHVNLLFANLDGDYELITRAENDLAFSTQRFDLGAYYADAWYYGLEEMFGYGGEYARSQVETWKLKLGSDGTIPLAEALIHNGDAWKARGGGYADKIPDEGWTLYYAGLDRALAALEQASDRLKATAPYHDMRLRILLHMRGKRQAALEEFNESIKRWPDYRRFYSTAGKVALPEWGGDFKVLDGIAREAVKRNAPDEGALIYSWFYGGLIVDEGRYTMSDTEVDWKLMKRGIQLWTDRQATNIYTLELFAKSACQMRDRDEARRIYEVIDARAKPGEGTPKVSDACRVYATAK